MKTVLITGATSGIGKATVAALANHNYQIIACGRNTEMLEEIKATYSQQILETLKFDVRDKQEVFNAINKINIPINILINNAGNAHGLATFDQADIEDLDAMIDINIKGLIYVTKATLPKMMVQNNGHIINISSIAGKQVYQNGTTYCASKFAVEALTQGMRMDLAQHNIKVTGIAPGAVETNFSLTRFKGDKEKADAAYTGYQPLTAEDIANTIAYILMQPDHVQIADVTILPSAQASATQILRK